MVKRKTKRRPGRPRKPGRPKGKKRQRGRGVGLAASVLTPITIDVIGTSITKKKPVTKVLRDYFK